MEDVAVQERRGKQPVPFAGLNPKRLSPPKATSVAIVGCSAFVQSPMPYTSSAANTPIRVARIAQVNQGKPGSATATTRGSNAASDSRGDRSSFSMTPLRESNPPKRALVHTVVDAVSTIQADGTTLANSDGRLNGLSRSR